MKILSNKTYNKMLSENKEYHSFVRRNEHEKDDLRQSIKHEKDLREVDRKSFERKLKYAIDNPSKFKHGEYVVIIETGKKHKIKKVEVKLSFYKVLLNVGIDAFNKLLGIKKNYNPPEELYYLYNLCNNVNYKAFELKKPRVQTTKTKQG